MAQAGQAVVNRPLGRVLIFGTSALVLLLLACNPRLYLRAGVPPVAPFNEPPLEPLIAPQQKPLASDALLLAIRKGMVWGWGGQEPRLCPTKLQQLPRRPGEVADYRTYCVSPGPLDGLRNVIGVAAAYGHFLGLDADGTVWAWGKNDFGVLGSAVPTPDARRVEVPLATPVSISGLTDVRDIAVGLYQALAVGSDGVVWTWGSDFPSLGQRFPLRRGLGTSPVQVEGIDRVRAVAAGTIHSLAIREDGTVWGWGTDCDGSLASGVAYPCQAGLTSFRLDGHVIDLVYNDRIDAGPPGGRPEAAPVPIHGLTHVRAIAAGQEDGLAADADGHVWAWGSGYLRGSSFEVQARPVEVPCLHDIQSIATEAIWGHNLALRQDGTVWAWGDVRVPTQADPGCPEADAPGMVLGLPHIVAITSGYTSLALAVDGSVWAWDREGLAPVGVGPVFLQTAPAPVQNLPPQ